MANFLDDISVYSAKAAAAISLAVTQGNSPKANLMSSLKTTANDITLTDAVRLEALTALINIGALLDIPLPPYFPVVTTYDNTQTYVGDHNSLTGIQGGAAGEYYHLTSSQLAQALNAASIGDITFANLGGVYSQNASLNNALLGKQNVLNGTGFVKISGTTITYDNSTYLTSTTLNATALTGELTGTFGNASVSNAAVISKVLTGWDGSASPASVSSSDTIISALQKINANINNVIASPPGVSTAALTNNAASVFTTTSSPASGAVTLNLGLNTQSGNLILASPNSASGQPSFRSLVSNDLPNSGASAGSYGSTTSIPVITVDAKGRITNVTNVTAASGGQVNSITLAVPSFLALSSIDNTNPAIPEIVLQTSTQSANTVFAGPVSGVAIAPQFRSLVQDDIPSLDPSKITGLTNILDGFLTDSLSDGSIWIGNTSNAAVQRVLSGDVTVSNTGVTAIGLAKVQYDMIQDVTTQTLLGRYAAVDGEVQQITLLNTDFVLDSGTGVLSLASPVAPVVTTKGDLLGHDLTAQQRVPSNNIDGSILLVNNSATGTYTDLGLNWVAMSGDATINAAGALTIANSAVTLGKMANLAANSFIGNNTGSAATPIALTVAQATAMLNQFSSTAKGLAPAVTGPAVGDATYFLNATGGWTQPGGGGGGGTTTNALTIGSGLSGTAATFNGSAAVTVSLNTGNANTWTALQTFESNIYLGAAGGSAGNARFRGSTSGYVALAAPAIAGTQTYTLPTAYPASASGYYLTSNTSGTLSWAAVSGTGDVVGPAGATANAIAVFNGATGLIIKDSGVTFPIGVSNGGIGITSGTSGGVLFFSNTTTLQSSAALAANALVIGGGAGVAPSTITTGTGVVTALGVNTGSSGAFVVNGGALGTPSSGTLTSATGLPLSTGVTGTLPVANGGTGQTTYTDGQLLIGNSTGNTLTKATLTAGSGISITNGAGSISIAATGAASISIGSTVTSGTTGSVLFVGSGPVLSQSNANFFWDNTNSRLGLTTTSPTGILHINSTNVTATIPHLLLAATTTTPTGSVGGSLWYYASGTTEYLGLYKSNAALVTKLITKDRNPDFATTGSGILVSDNNGTLTKSAELTALGIFAQTSTVTVGNTGTSTTLLGTLTGSATLPANFFAVGKTIKVFVSGTYNQDTGSETCALNLTIGGVAVGTITFTHSGALTTVYYDAEFTLTCRTAGASGTLQFIGFGRLNHTGTDLLNYFQVSSTSASINTGGTLAIDLQADWVTADPNNSITASILTAIYLN